MKKQAMILLVFTCLFAISIPMSVAADPDDNYLRDEILSNRTDPEEFIAVRMENGFISDRISVAFRDGDFNASEKYFFYVTTNQWAWESRNMQRPLYFDFNQSYERNDTGGLYIIKDLIVNEANEPVSARAVCYWNVTRDRDGIKIVDYATICFNTNSTYTTAKSQVRNSEWINNNTILRPEVVYFTTTATHEVGHALGLGHVRRNNDDNNTSIMSSPSPQIPMRAINDVDRANFRQIYNKNSRARNTVMILQDEEHYMPENNQTYDVDMRIEICYDLMNDSELIDRSDLIIKGRVKEILPTEWTTTDGRPLSQNNMQDVNILHLFHSIVVEVDETYKGELKTDEIIIHKSGGTFDNIRITTSNPDYYENEEVILYLREKPVDSGVVYIQTHDGGSQIFIIDDDLGVNGRGEEVNIPELINTVLNQQDNE